jgi:predicted N-formylglutamate amidohydrolase
MTEAGIIRTCEHASAAVPTGYEHFFAGAEEILRTHRAYDPGAVETADDLSSALGCASPLKGEFTRLLIDLNRSLSNPRMFSEFSPPRGDGLRDALVEIYHEFRNRALERVRGMIFTHGAAVHYSIHSFTPVLDGIQRNADIGLLYDPSRASEVARCKLVAEHLRAEWPDLRVRFNYPYRGVADGHTTALRRTLGAAYTGIEIELNHGSYFDDRAKWRRMVAAIVAGVGSAEDVGRDTV